jgi:hypothetical protein
MYAHQGKLFKQLTLLYEHPDGRNDSNVPTNSRNNALSSQQEVLNAAVLEVFILLHKLDPLRFTVCQIAATFLSSFLNLSLGVVAGSKRQEKICKPVAGSDTKDRDKQYRWCY